MAKKDVKIPVKDVSHPNETPASPTAKPVIVSNRPIMHDPMVNQDENTEGQPREVTLRRGSSETTLRPLTDPDSPAASTEQAKDEPPKEKVSEQPPAAEEKPEETENPAEVNAETPAEVKPAAEENEAASKTPPSKAEEAPSPQPTGSSEEKKKPSAEETEAAEAAKKAEHAAVIDKLVESKQFYLPINAVERRRSKHVAVLGLILSVLLLLAWADIALDAGILHIAGLKPVTHFFSN